ncbi:hypothetical protein WN944_006322 [Citrus x changshan-huyou]|uniref:Uncharacterized protein n=1 Tax=Citrus x changshan-huyou TaxID=2935761 RepID=A0AAP0QPJ8_9ROSI
MGLEWVALRYAVAAEAIIVLPLTLPRLDGLQCGASRSDTDLPFLRGRLMHADGALVSPEVHHEESTQGVVDCIGFSVLLVVVLDDSSCGQAQAVELED